MIFPPAFFDVMIHLVVHLANEARLRLGGSVQYRWMLLVERYLGTLKRKLRNRARPEGSIVEFYIVNECLTFCSLYMNGVETVFNKLERNNDLGVHPTGKLSIFSTRVRLFSHSKFINLSKEDLKLLH